MKIPVQPYYITYFNNLKDKIPLHIVFFNIALYLLSARISPNNALYLEFHLYLAQIISVIANYTAFKLISNNFLYSEILLIIL